MSKKGYLKVICVCLICATVFTLLSALVVPTFAHEYVTGANPISKSFRKSEFYSRLSSLTLTGDGRTDVLAVALTQLGYLEGAEDGDFGGLVDGSNNFTEYNYNMGSFGQGYGGANYPWCASFVSYSLLQARTHKQNKISDWCRSHKGDANYIWREVSCSQWATQLRTCGYFKNANHYGGTYTPVAGDLIFFTNNGSTESHIGIVIKTDETYVYTVEGNTSAASGLEVNGEGVHYKAHKLTSSYVRGYGVLPYEVNADSKKIDFNAPSLSRGFAISVKPIDVYSEKDSKEALYSLSSYSFLEITNENCAGKLEVLFEKDGETEIGYIDNSPAKLLQISLYDNVDGIKSYDKADGYKSHGVESYTVGIGKYTEKPSNIEMTDTQKITVDGWMGFDEKITSVGYYFDGDSDNIIWQPEAKLDAEKDAVAEAGANAIGFSLTVTPAGLENGSHTATLAAKLSDMRIVIIDTLAFNCVKVENYTPVSPSVQSFGANSLTITPTEGYEYRIDGGEWQADGKFEIADMSAEHLLTQRIAATENSPASLESEPIKISLEALFKTTRLEELTVQGAELSPAFDPEVVVYNATLEANAELEINAKAYDGSQLEISDYSKIDPSEGGKASITVLSPYGVNTTYVINIKPVPRPTEAPTEAPESDPPLKDKSGCGGEISLLALMPLLCFVPAIRKKDDN